MNSPRPSSRRDYRHFPEAYTSLLLQFDERGSASLGPMSHADAKAGTRDLYRFKMFLSHGCDTDPDDAHARRLLRIFAKCILRIEPVATVNPCQRPAQCNDHGFGPEKCSQCNPHAHVINLSLNPIVAAMERASP